MGLSRLVGSILAWKPGDLGSRPVHPCLDVFLGKSLPFPWPQDPSTPGEGTLLASTQASCCHWSERAFPLWRTMLMLNCKAGRCFLLCGLGQFAPV